MNEMKPRRNRSSAAVAVAVVTAVFVAAGSGGAVAGALVTSKQIKNNTITTKDVKNSTLTGVDVKDGGLTGADLAAGTVGGPQVGNGSLGLEDLSPAARAALGTLVISGGVSLAGQATRVSAPAGITVTSERIATGIYCVRVTGTATPLDATNAVMAVSADYSASGTNTNGNGDSAIVEAARLSGGRCVGGFQVMGFNHAGGGGPVTASDQGFTFIIH